MQFRIPPYLLLSGLAMAYFPTAFSQNTQDKIYLFYEASPSTDLKNETGRSKYSSLFELSLGSPPINITSKLKWIHSFYGKATNLNLENLKGEYSALASKLYDVEYGQIFLYTFDNPQWSLFAAPKIMIRSDFKENQIEKGILPSGIILANYTPERNPKWTWSFGIALANDFNRNQIIPIAGISYKSTKYFIEIAYPRVNLLYKPQKQIEWGITGAVTGGIFKTTDITLPDGENSPFTRIINVSIGHTFNYLLNDKLVINTCAGYLPVRNYDLLNNEYKPVQSNNTDLKASLFFRTGLSVRL